MFAQQPCAPGKRGQHHDSPVGHSPQWTSALLDRVCAPASSPLPLPRLLLVLAHPDDEILTFGGRLERLSASHLLTATDGAPLDGADAKIHGFASLESYRAARRDELHAALQHAGLSREVLVAPGTFSPLPVPDQTAALHLEALANAVAAAISSFAPEAVLTHPYEGGHPDHDACAFAVHNACRLLQPPHTAACGHGVPVILEAPFYHARADGSMGTGSFLEPPFASRARTCELSTEEQVRKQARLRCFRSQAATLAHFGTEREIFRVAPPYDFEQPPHPGHLLYERFPWGMQGSRFRALAADANRRLRTSPTAGMDAAAGQHRAVGP